MAGRYFYSRWDGMQQIPGFDANDLFADVTDDLIRHGDPDVALQRVLRDGFETRDGKHVEGLVELLERLRKRRRELLEDGNPDGNYTEIAKRPTELVEEERIGIDDMGGEQVHKHGLTYMADLDSLEAMLDSTRNPRALADVDMETARRLMGDDAARHLETLSGMTRSLEKRGLTERRDGCTELTPLGLHKMGANALRDLFRNLDPQALGRHTTYQRGIGTERTYESKPYEFGDPFNLDIQKTVRNAVTRRLGTPVRLARDDFEVECTERLTRTSTVLAIDLSLSMPTGNFFVPAKKVAFALHHLITSRYPADYVGLIGFSEVARQLDPRQLPAATWDYVYGTNYQHAFALARQLLANQPGTKQIIMITDGAPTAHIEPDGTPFFEYPTSQATARATMAEVNRCTRVGVTINTFMLEDNPHLGRFVEQMTELNRGRAFYATPDKLGEYLLVDFLEHRRRRSAS